MHSPSPFPALILLAVICFGLKFLLEGTRRKATGATGKLPYSRRKYLLTVAERSFYEVLLRLVPGHTLFAKVRLADLLQVSKDTPSRQSHFNRIQSKHVDFVVCNSDLSPVLVVELDDASHDHEKRRSRDSFVDAALLAASLPIVHVRAQRGYVPDEVRQMILPFLSAQAAASN